MHNFLYQDNPAPSARAQGNAGLWYNKFFKQWNSPDEVKIPEEGKKRWIDTVADGKPVGDSEEIKHYIARISQLLESQRPDKESESAEQNDAQAPHPLYRCYKLESDFVTGLGLEHPVENGFAWHHSLGTPYLPGSSVKGLVRAWVEQWQADSISDEDFTRIFGSKKRHHKKDEPKTGTEGKQEQPKEAQGSENQDADKDNKKQAKEADNHAGSVIFLDALPMTAVRLKADIITPHYGDYYQDESGSTAPADWLSPNPIPFLVVEKGCTFFFGIAPVLSRQAKDAQLEQAKKDCKKVQKWLKGALEWLGAGAKTAVGYGRFSFDAAATARQEQVIEGIRKAEEEAKIAAQEEALAEENRKSMSPLRREMDEQGYRKENFNIQAWVDRMEATPEPEKYEIANHLDEWYRTIFLPKQTNNKLNKKHSKRFDAIQIVLASCPKES